MTNTITTTINFHGADLIAIEGKTPSEILVAMKPIVVNMSLDWKSQYRKISENPVLKSTMVIKTTVGEDGKEREMSCLPLDMLNFWLATIHPDRIKNEATRAKIIAYQTECARVLFNHFFGKTQKQDTETLTEKVVGGIVKRGVHKQLETVVAGLAVLTEQMNEMKKELHKPHKTLSHGGEHRLENAAKSAVAALTAIQLDSVKKDWAIEAVELLQQSEMLHDLAMERLDNACLYMRIEDRNNAPFLRFGDIVGYRKIDGFVYDGFYVLELLGKKVVYQCQHIGNGHIRLIAGSTAQVITHTEFEQHVRGIIVMRCNIMNEKALMGAPIRKSTYSPGPQQALAV